MHFQVKKKAIIGILSLKIKEREMNINEETGKIDGDAFPYA
jgi:hypothetical protein